MSITTTDQGDAAAHEGGDGADHGNGPAVAGAENPGGMHETAYRRDQKERLMLWLFIGGDALFLILEVFTWFYLRSLNVNGLWNGALCTKANPCTDGLGNPITAPITKADPKHAIIIAVFTVLAAGFVWAAETAARKSAGKRTVATWSGVALLCMLVAVGWQIYQFQVLPFTTVGGAYPSTYEFFMGSTLAHLILLAFIGLGLWMRAMKGRYEGGTWYRVRIIRFFAVWIAVSTVILVAVGALFY
jgi:heme/copper-type cytochrome/quinol oxidase subunit 3